MDKKRNSRRFLDQSMEYLKQFEQGEFTLFLDHLSDDYSGPFPRESLQAQWGQIIQAFGGLKEVLESDVSSRGEETTVAITALHILRKLIITFTFHEDGTVSRTDFDVAPLDVKPQTTETWEEISIQIGVSEKKLNGMLTLPKGESKPPVVILLQGSGPTNMNEQLGLGGNMPFADLASGLAERGIATIRYDKRSYAYPEDVVLAGVEMEYLEDAGAAVKLALEEERVDGGRIFLLGHSEGGMVGPEVVRQNPDIRGFISLAGTLRRLEDIILEQTKKILSDTDAMSDESKQAQLEAVEQAVLQIKQLDPQDQSTMVLGASARYWHSLSAIDTGALAAQMSIPILILQGGEDFQVPAQEDYPLWQKALSKKDNVTFRLYPRLNHLFMVGGTKDHIDLSVYDKPGRVDTQMISDLGEWIRSVTL